MGVMFTTSNLVPGRSCPDVIDAEFDLVEATSHLPESTPRIALPLSEARTCPLSGFDCLSCNEVCEVQEKMNVTR